MSPSTRQLIEYARYHRDARNIATHYVGIPLIVFGIAVMLARLPAGAWLAWALASVWYLRQGRDTVVFCTIAAVGALVLAATPLGGAAMATWLAAGLGSFVVGWIFQALGHVWEGRKPAFFDDLRGLLVGPMFVVAEALWAAGRERAVLDEVEAAAGPVRRGSTA